MRNRTSAHDFNRGLMVSHGLAPRDRARENPWMTRPSLVIAIET